MLRVLLCVVVIVVTGIACEDDPSTTDDGMVTIGGTVRNVDDGSIAAGVNVRQFGTKYGDDFDTGSDGKFEFQVPRGTALMLLTDDRTPAIDEWFPMINVDIIPIVADHDILDLPIHACPQVPPGSVGSLAIWQRYLMDCDDTENGDIFLPKTLEGAGGTIAMLTLDCTFAGSDSISCSTGLSEAPIEYMSAAQISFTPAPTAAQCNVFHPVAVDQTDALGWAQGFFDSTLTADYVDVIFTDNKSTRGISFPASVRVPIGKGIVSLMLVGIHNNAAVSFPTLAEECGFFP